MAKAKEKKKARREKMMSAKEKAARNAAGGSSVIPAPKGVKQFEVKKGKFKLNIIPFTAGEGNPDAKPGKPAYERVYYVHYNVGANNKGYVCANQPDGPSLNKKGCPVCDYLKKLSRDDPDDKAIWNAMKRKKKSIVLLEDLTNAPGELQYLDGSYANFMDRVVSEADKEGLEYPFEPDTEDGRTVVVRIDEDSFEGRKFMVFDKVDFEERKKDVPDKLLDAAPCLDDCVKALPYDELKELLMQGGGSEEEDEDDEDEKPQRGKKGKSRKQDDEDEEEDEDEPDEDDGGIL